MGLGDKQHRVMYFRARIWCDLITNTKEEYFFISIDKGS